MAMTRVLPLFVVPLIRSPPITAVDPLMVIFFASRVDVGPSQVEQLAAAGSGVGGEVEEGEQPVLPGGGQEGLELGDGPDGSGFASRHPWPFSAFHGVAADEAVDDDRVTECFPQDRVQVNHGRDGERLAAVASTGQ
jgi:hypothetical protein